MRHCNEPAELCMHLSVFVRVIGNLACMGFLLKFCLGSVPVSPYSVADCDSHFMCIKFISDLMMRDSSPGMTITFVLESFALSESVTPAPTVGVFDHL